MKEKMQFKTETKKLLDMMIHSIYTHREIFLRELISNASDAIDKRHFLSLTDESLKGEDYQIVVEADKVARTLKITDNGIGMSKEELMDNLGTIAKSGSKEFIENLDQNTPDIDIIGQFGVGFYSAFMVANKIEVLTRKAGSNVTYKFVSDGIDSYEIEDSNDIVDGTIITLYLRDNTEDINYDEFLEEYKLTDLIRKYSDYVRYPIKTWVTKYDPKDDDDKDSEPKTHLELETINSMIPIWKKKKSEVTDEELNKFYKEKFFDYQDPLAHVFINVEGMLTYNSLLFIPRKPMFMNKDNKRGLQLYTKGVFILDKCEELIPEYLGFVKGLVDSADLPLNISRELLQEDKEIKKIATNVEKKIISELGRLLKNDRDKYLEFFETYGRNIKFGIYENYGSRKDMLEDIILLYSLNQDKYITFNEYVEAMKEGQKNIYYVSAQDKTSAAKLPQMDLLKSKGYDVLVLFDDVDEFMLQQLKSYKEHDFKSISQGDLDLLDEDEKKKIDDLATENKDLIEALKEALKDDVTEVVLSKRLVDAPVCLTTKDGLSLEMEKALKQQNPFAKAERVLEINPNHELFNKLKGLDLNDKDTISDFASILYDQALIIEGMSPKDPVKFANRMCELLIK